MASFAKVSLFAGTKEIDITRFVDLKKDFDTKELSLQNSKELTPTTLNFEVSRDLSIVTGNTLTGINGFFMSVIDNEDRTIWAGFVDDIQEDKKGKTKIFSKNFAGNLANLDIKTDPPLVFDGATAHNPIDAIIAIWSGTGLNIPARYFDLASFEDVKAQTGESLRPIFEEGDKALDAIQELMMAGGFIIFTQANVLRAKTFQSDIVQYTIDENEVIGYTEKSWKVDEVKTSVKGTMDSVKQEITEDVNTVAVLGFRPFVIKQDVVNSGGGQDFNNIALRILSYFGANQDQNVLIFSIDVDFINPEHQAKYYAAELFDFVAVHTPDLRIEAFLIEKSKKKGKLTLKFRAVRWEHRKENNISFTFT